MFYLKPHSPREEAEIYRYGWFLGLPTECSTYTGGRPAGPFRGDIRFAKNPGDFPAGAHKCRIWKSRYIIDRIIAKGRRAVGGDISAYLHATDGEVTLCCVPRPVVGGTKFGGPGEESTPGSGLGGMNRGGNGMATSNADDAMLRRWMALLHCTPSLHTKARDVYLGRNR